MNPIQNITIADLKGIWKSDFFALRIMENDKYQFSVLINLDSRMHYKGDISIEYIEDNMQKLILTNYGEVILFQIMGDNKIVLTVMGNNIIFDRLV